MHITLCNEPAYLKSRCTHAPYGAAWLLPVRQAHKQSSAPMYVNASANVRWDSVWFFADRCFAFLFGGSHTRLVLSSGGRTGPGLRHCAACPPPSCRGDSLAVRDSGWALSTSSCKMSNFVLGVEEFRGNFEPWLGLLELSRLQQGWGGSVSPQ